VIEVALLTVNDVALVAPNRTAVAPVRFVPVMVTLVPPAAGPLFGLTLVIVGAGAAAAVNALPGATALWPPVVVTRTFTVPLRPGGTTAVICVGLLTVKDVAGTEPKWTALTVM
jgi:hypothetical protein